MKKLFTSDILSRTWSDDSFASPKALCVRDL